MRAVAMEAAVPPGVDSGRAAVAEAVLHGLGAERKALPPWLFYDAAGSALYERITELAEYYPTRTERQIFEDQGGALVASALGRGRGPVQVIELGAGSAQKSVVLLAQVAARAPGSRYVPVDVSATALAEAHNNVTRALPGLPVTPMVATHEEALAAVAALPGRKLVLFIGSSIGNYEDPEAELLLARVRAACGADGALVLGTDMKKAPAVLVPAYDDAEGVTAAFNLNLLARLNRELGANFALERFRHVALWNEGASRIEMHLESCCAQEVLVAALERSFAFGAGERIHTESSIKYDLGRIDALFERAGLARTATFSDARGYFADHVAHPDVRQNA